MDVYNQKKLWELLRDFYNLVGLKVCIYDSDEEELVYYPEKLSSVCALLREDEKMEERCRECDRRAFAQCKKTYKQYVYTCHAGLMECMSPIIYDKKIIGYIITTRCCLYFSCGFLYLLRFRKNLLIEVFL